MAVWRSTPGHDRHTRWKDWAIAAVAVWLGAVPLGLAVLALAYLLGTLPGLSGAPGVTHPLAALYILGYVLFFSPMLSWAGLLLALPPAWLMLRRGFAGWGSFGMLGLISGTLAGGFFDGFTPTVAGLHGLAAALAFRWILFRLSPEIFTAR